MNDERRIDRMRGCACLGKFMLVIIAAALAIYCVLNLNQCFMTSCYAPSGDQRTVRDLKIAITAYAVETNRFPILQSDSPGLDLSTRSRGLMLPILSGQTDAVLNPKTIRFIELPMAKNRKGGLWNDGGEWMLGDIWGELYYLVLDTNEDNVITNPDPDAARALPQIPAEVLVYSSGPDRDPKTWHDNICSWRN